MLEEMSADEFASWAEYNSLEPIGFPADDAMHGILSYIVAASKGAKGIDHKTFMLRPPEDQPDEERLAEDLKKFFENLVREQEKAKKESGNG